MDVRDRLSGNMRRLRRSKDWSQEELAHQSGIHRTYISDLERGARNPTIEVVDKIAVALGVPCGELLD
ncbi:helix-turn-helix domain-containing protein [Ruegeria arenilitoris]|uniref:helix-turn-helix domain-containing protein n=1 Tax=Ruegeria arenilitoris TaxID=1173585 RepID=UPI00147F31CB|nr:helix-turn-helix transcriptional regulator [Ruegeria arenilitoris]